MNTESILQGLNEPQVQAVRAIDGPVLILAGAGSGKTKALTHRIAYLIAKGIQPQNILAVTFTNKAAEEMKQRVAKLLVKNEGERIESVNKSMMPMMGTFHSVCLRILRRDADKLEYDRNFVIYDTDDQLTLIKRSMEQIGIDPKKHKPQTFLHGISQLKSELITPDQAENQANEYSQEITAQIYTTYQGMLRASNAVDFDDLIMLCVQLFKGHPTVLDNYQELFKYIMIDEYQDTNHAQYKWANLLAKKYRNIATVGDDSQAIYGWRQADIRNILDFEKDYPEALVIKLEQNYRSTKTILNAANAVISKNLMQKPKTLWTNNESGVKIIVKETEDERQEGQYIIQTIKKDMNNLTDERFDAKHRTSHQTSGFNKFVILYRTHAQSRSIEETFIKHGIPYRIIGGIKFYERREIKDILAYLRLLVNTSDNVAFGRVYNIPNRGIGVTSFKKLRDAGINIHVLLEYPEQVIILVGPKQAKSFINFVTLLKTLRTALEYSNLSSLVQQLIKTIKYELYINDKTKEGQERWENVKEILTATRKFDSMPGIEGLQKFLEEVALIQETDKMTQYSEAITLMTLHSAKGLEFPQVFMIGMEDGIFPHSRSLLNIAELEEERRLCYVGITRAQNNLHIIFVRRRNIYGSTSMNPPSRFIFEIPENLVNFSPAQYEGPSTGGRAGAHQLTDRFRDQDNNWRYIDE